jgi:hypothetical protein
MSMKYSNDTIGNRTRDLVAQCSTAGHPTKTVCARLISPYAPPTYHLDLHTVLSMSPVCLTLNCSSPHPAIKHMKHHVTEVAVLIAIYVITQRHTCLCKHQCRNMGHGPCSQLDDSTRSTTHSWQTVLCFVKDSIDCDDGSRKFFRNAAIYHTTRCHIPENRLI